MTEQQYDFLSNMYKDANLYSADISKDLLNSFYYGAEKGCPSDGEWIGLLEHLEKHDKNEIYKRYPVFIDILRQIMKESVVLDTGEYDEDDGYAYYDVMFRDQFDEYAKKYPEIEESELLKKIFICRMVYGNTNDYPYDFENHKWHKDFNVEE